MDSWLHRRKRLQPPSREPLAVRLRAGGSRGPTSSSIRTFATANRGSTSAKQPGVDPVSSTLECLGRLARAGRMSTKPGQLQPPHPPGRVALLARRLQVGLKPGVDQRPVRAELGRRPAHRRALRRRQRRQQHRSHRPPMHTMAACKRPDRQPLAIAVTPDLFELLHSGSHSFEPPVRAPSSANRQAAIGRRWDQFKPSQWGQFRTSFSQVHPAGSRIPARPQPVGLRGSRHGRAETDECGRYTDSMRRSPHGTSMDPPLTPSGCARTWPGPSCARPERPGAWLPAALPAPTRGVQVGAAAAARAPRRTR